jgi:two-component sensor histidine kinase
MLLSMVLCNGAIAQNTASLQMGPVPEEQLLLKNFAAGKTSKQQIEAALALSDYYTLKQGEKAEDLDQAMIYALKAKDISTRTKNSSAYNNALFAIATICIERGNSRAAFEVVNEAPDSARIRLLLQLSTYYYYGGQLTTSSDSAIYCALEAKKISRRIGRPDKEIDVLLHLTDLYSRQPDIPAATKQYDEVIPLIQKNPMPAKHLIYMRLSTIQIVLGNYNLALAHAVTALKEMERTKDYVRAVDLYENLGFLYKSISQFENSIHYYDLAIGIYKKQHRSTPIWFATQNIVDVLLKMKQPDQALVTAQRTAKKFAPVNDDERHLLAKSLANCYRALRKYELAEKYYLEMDSLCRNRYFFDAGGYRDMSQFYIEQNRFNEAAVYLQRIIPYINAFTAPAKAQLYILFYKVDSASGNYASAMQYLVKSKMLEDTVWQLTKTRQIQEIQVQYETEKKDQALKLKEQNILLLSRQAELRQKDLDQVRLELQYEAAAKAKDMELSKLQAARKDKDLLLKQQNIELLKNEALLKQSSLENANLTKNISFASLVLLFVIVVLLYNQYRIKQKNNREVNLKNQSLLGLVEEKELLLKEVHHRVKNNLHTIISLLETQSTYLKDDALAAVQNSQHRVYAMSLIHQKLYQLDNSTNINMAVYLPELLHYLADSFGTGNRIRFQTNIDNIHLDISQAIPAGLILNEAITNSIKYAFPGNKDGIIEIEMIYTTGNNVRFSVADNGIGLRYNWQSVHTSSLGLKLMKGLSEDIRASFTIHNHNGTRIIVEFEKHLFLGGPEEKIIHSHT